MYILGVPGVHNPSWCLIKDGVPLIQIDRERLDRIKDKNHILSKKWELLDEGIPYILRAAGIDINDIDCMVHAMNPYCVEKSSEFATEEEFLEWVCREQLIFNELIRVKYGYRNRFYYVRHHLAHAAAAYFCSPFNESAILTIDGRGEEQTMTLNRASGTSIQFIKDLKLPHSLGNFYTTITEILGWHLNQEGKTMGLASFGKHENRLKYFDVFYTNEELVIKEKWVDVLQTYPRRQPQEDIMQSKYLDLAAQAQFEIEYITTEISRYLHKITGLKNLCYAGGVALNSVANNIIVESSGFENFFILPGSGDSGAPLGAALYAYYELSRVTEKNPYFMENAYLGREYFDAEVLAIFDKYSDSISFEKQDNIEKCAATLIAEGKIIGWFQGKSEFGPRALGNRSIFADPRNYKTKDDLNNRIKHRESFRPFAPVVMEEYAKDYFNIKIPSPFMLLVAKVLDSKINKIPAVIHVDGTARVQTVNPQQNSKLYSLINEFFRITKIPVVLNTSFNVAGEPIVETPEDAIRCFIHSNIDRLIIHSYLVLKRKNI
jgi:carbamoyltransferase